MSKLNQAKQEFINNYRRIRRKMKNIRMIIENIGLGKYICTSFEEAAKNSRRKNIVIIENSDVYFTYIFNNMFGELCSWSSDEFEEDESLYDRIQDYAKNIYSRTVKEIDSLIINNLTMPISVFHFTKY